MRASLRSDRRSEPAPSARRERDRERDRERARRRREESYAFWRGRPIRAGTIFYESFGGNGALCNPEAIFRQLVTDPEFSSFRHIWALGESSGAERIRAEFAGDRRVRFVAPGQPAYFEALATSRYLINNATFPRAFSKRPGQVYLNTWHGVPLKRMGFAIGDPASRVANVLRNFLHADYLLSGNRFMTEQLYARGHRLDGLFHGTILEVGTPRVDRQFVDAREVEAIRAELAATGLPVGDREIVLFAPTWKGTNFLRPDNDAETLRTQAVELQRRLGVERYVVLLKTHQAVQAFAAGRPEFDGLLVPHELPTNRLLAATAVLVTDYSSIFFDFLSLDRPIHFLAPDLADYEGYRGFYLAPETWPGPISVDVAGLAAGILEESSGIGPALIPAAAERRAAARQRFAAHEDGAATARVIDIVFRGADAGAGAVRLDAPARPTVLAIVGTVTGDEALAAIASDLARRDLDLIDVTVLVSDSRRKAFVAWQQSLDPRIRVVVRQGNLGGTRVGRLLRLLRLSSATKLWTAEVTRVFGAARFDSVVLFSPEQTFWKPFAEAARGGRS